MVVFDKKKNYFFLLLPFGKGTIKNTGSYACVALYDVSVHRLSWFVIYIVNCRYCHLLRVERTLPGCQLVPSQEQTMIMEQSPKSDYKVEYSMVV